MKKNLIFLLTLMIATGTTYAKVDPMCEKGEGPKKLTIRSFEGNLCTLPHIAKWALKACEEAEGFTNSKCHKHAEKAAKKSTKDPKSLPEAIVLTGKDVGEKLQPMLKKLQEQIKK